MKTVDDYLSKLSYATIGMILRGSDYEKAKNLDTDQNSVTTEPATNVQIEAHKH